MANVTKAVKLFLQAKAIQGMTTTYEEIASALGLPQAWPKLGATLSPILGEIFTEEHAAGEPYLTSIVVRKSGQDHGLPGAGFWVLVEQQQHALVAVNREQKRALTQNFQQAVFAHYAA